MTPRGYDRIERLTAGDDWETPPLFYNDVPAGQSLQQIRFTARESLDGAPIIEKTITTSIDPGNGQITDNGFTTGTARWHLEFPATQTILLAPGLQYLCDIEARSSAGKAKTIRKFTLVADAQVTT